MYAESHICKALDVRRLLISSNSLKVIENIQFLRECKADRDEYPHQVIVPAQANSEIDPILIPNYYRDAENMEEDDLEPLLHIISIINETTNDAYTISTGNLEQLS